MICLNCKTEIQGRFCHNCGQENLEPKESVGHLISHFFQDITHFDGKFFSTVKYLLIRPGFLSTEYMLGRRASYVNPVRMYIFTSAFFFLIFFTFFKMDNKDIITIEKNGKTLAQIEAEIIIGVGIFFYLYKAMRNFYRQRRAKTVIKFLMLCLLLLITMMLLFLFFFFFSLFKL